MTIDEVKKKHGVLWQLSHILKEGTESGMDEEQYHLVLLTNIATSLAVIADLLIEKMRMEDNE